MSEPREWTLFRRHDSPGWAVAPPDGFVYFHTDPVPESVHVIEKRALDEALAEVHRLQDALMAYEHTPLELGGSLPNPTIMKLTKERDELIQNEHKMNAALSAKQEIIEGLKAEVERLKEENNVRNIPLFKQENAKLREENEYLKHELDKLRPHYANLTEERNRLREALERIASAQWVRCDIESDEYAHKIARHKHDDSKTRG